MLQIALATLLSQHSLTVSIKKLQIIIVQFLFLIFAAILLAREYCDEINSNSIIIVVYYINKNSDIFFYI